MKKSILIKCIGNHIQYQVPGEPWKDMGRLENSVGPYGESTGLFRSCRTTHPITEISEEELGGKAYWYRSLKPVPQYL